jgi:hypothetical protein
MQAMLKRTERHFSFAVEFVSDLFEVVIAI